MHIANSYEKASPLAQFHRRVDDVLAAAVEELRLADDLRRGLLECEAQVVDEQGNAAEACAVLC